MTERAHTHTKNCEEQPVHAHSMFPSNTVPRAAGFFGREAPEYSDLKMTEVVFFLSLVNNPEVSGLDLKGSFSFVSPPSTRATFLKLPLFKDRFLYIQCAEDQYFGLDSTDHAFVFHNNVKL